MILVLTRNGPHTLKIFFQQLLDLNVAYSGVNMQL